MSSLIEQALEHWPYVAPLLSKIESDAEYDLRVEDLDELLAIVGDDDEHPLARLVSLVGDVVEAYDQVRYPVIQDGVEGQ